MSSEHFTVEELALPFGLRFDGEVFFDGQLARLGPGGHFGFFGYAVILISYRGVAYVELAMKRRAPTIEEQVVSIAGEIAIAFSRKSNHARYRLRPHE